ncbi:MAG: 3-keto-5-aminohexanoate cleavage protein [Candidatus Lokiarchaeota archaeon]|nr:3-keto-5-aminohexanoate cleavage protein [Candidatus Lokiarchaeota archaeon]
MKDDISNKMIITAALTGASTTREQNPAIPHTAEEFGEEAKKCYEAGASIVHLHVRNPTTGLPEIDLEIIRAALANIKSKAPDLIINLSTAINTLATQEQRIAPVKNFKPPLASLNSNSMNFSIGDYKTGRVIKGGDNIFANDFKLVQAFAKEMKNVGTKPEIEIYDMGGMYNILFLNKQDGLFKQPLHFQFVFGVLGGIPFTMQNLALLTALLPPGSTWSVCGVAKQQFQAGICAAALGGHVRVGLEDNIRLISGELAKGSWEQVEWAVRLARITGRDVASPSETRELLRLRNKDISI